MRSWIFGGFVLLRIARRLVSGYLLIRFAWPFMATRAREESVQHWCRDVLRLLGIRLTVVGRMPANPAPRGLLLVCNHVSWVDTLAIHAVVPCGFLAKASVGRWPVIGRLIRKTGGVFVQRSNPFDLQRALETMDHALAQGRSICVFPEGTTTDGAAVRPFSTLVFELSAQRDLDVLPIGLRYRQHGAPTRLPAWIGDEAFLPSLLRIAGAEGIVVELVPGDPLPRNADRTRAAVAARVRIAELAGIALTADALVATGPGVERIEASGDPRVRDLVQVVRKWIAIERGIPLLQVGDRTPLQSFGVDSLAILRMVLELEERIGLRIDESKLELTSNATVFELSAAVIRSETC
ncbi:MAG: 1-acyl-sn-glycerol-3-phosphate acyltransferase [Betaproteobacteria bacterium]